MSIERATPFHFGDGTQRLFGWLHPSCGSADIGVVLCASLWREELYSHRTLMHVANAAAAAGMPALRFDYDGTGDSAGDDLQPGRVKAWTKSVHTAMDELKRRTGVRWLCLVGLRMGVPLALAAAAEREDTIAMLAIAPVVSGRTLMRELRVLSGSATTHSPEGRADKGLLEVGGFVLTSETQEAIAAINLLEVEPPPGLMVRILDRDDAPGAGRWSQALTQRAVQAEYSRVAGYPGMMEEAALNVMPRELIAEAAQWLEELSRSPMPASSQQPPAVRTRSYASLEMGDVQETAVSITGVGLAGILSEPTPGRRPDAASGCGIILLNAGIARRIGPSRVYVDLARSWASRGHAVLRFDLSGIGDSEAHSDFPEHTVYSGSAIEEVTQAVAFMRSRPGISKCVAVGLCAGAYHGLKTAMSGARLDTVVLINPLTFDWKPGDSLITTLDARAVTRVMSNYRRSVLSLEAWLRVLSQRQVMSRAIERVSRFLSLTIRRASHEFLKRLGLHVRGNLGSELEALGRRGVQAHFVFASGEPGPSLLQIHAGSSINRLERQSLLSRTHIAEADHIFTRLGSRHRLMQVLDGIIESKRE